VAGNLADTLAALIHGINVGRANRVAMADLRDLLSDLGYGDVRTLLNSGNAVFSAPTTGAEAMIAERIEAALAERLGVRTRVAVISASDLAAVVAGNPLRDQANDSSRLLVAFLACPSDLALIAALAEQDWAPEAIAVGERVAYLWCPNGVAESRLSRALGQALGDAVTARSWTTVERLLALM
jgi:uncharacterized protein (DUF1697 family)